MSNLAREIKPINIEDELKRSYLDYAMSVIIGRALPDVRDGLKPVHRRVLYAMHILGNDWNKIYKKSARIVGDVIGKYHPHGDSAVYDAIVRMAQPFSLRYTLIDGQGNFGSIDGDSAAAMRYTEIRLAKISHELMADLEKETIDFVDNYDGTEKIPEVMPTKIPNLLINGSSGIAVGMATNIPPHNITEVINACLAFVKNENVSIEELMEHIPGPDFPSAAIIKGSHGIESAYRTGRGKIFIRSRAKVQVNNKTGRESIIIYEIPYQTNKARLIEKIAELVKEKRIEGISALRDETDKDGMRIVIEIKRDAVGEVVLNNLFHSQAQLQVSFGINMVALHHGQPKVMNLKEIIESFISHRREVVIRRTIFELHKARSRASTLEAMAIALANINLVIEQIRCSSTPSEAKSFLISRPWDLGNIKIMLQYASEEKTYSEWIKENKNVCNDQYYLSEQQAQTILDLRLQKINNLEHKKILCEYKDLLEQINKLLKILSSTNRLTEVIQEELELIRDQFGDKRRTEITSSSSDIKIEDLINQEDVVVTLSHQGYIKYQPLTEYESQRRGGKGKSAAYIKEKDFIDHLLVTNTHDTILCFSSQGRLYWMKVHKIPETTRGARGRPIVNLLPLSQKEQITAILPVRKYEKGINIFMATANGTVKKTSLAEFNNPRSVGIIAIRLNKGDKLIGVDLTSGNDEVMLFSAEGKVVRFKENTVRTMGRTAIGVRGIKLEKQDKVVSLIIPRGKGTILTVTQKGYGKRTKESAYLTKSRGTQGVISIKVNKRNGFVVGAVQVNDCDQIIMITYTGTLVRTRVSEISIVGRNNQGVILIRTEENENVVGLQRIANTVSYDRFGIIKHAKKNDNVNELLPENYENNVDLDDIDSNS